MRYRMIGQRHGSGTAPLFWPGFQNPVWYVDDLMELGIDPETLDWQRIAD